MCCALLSILLRLLLLACWCAAYAPCRRRGGALGRISSRGFFSSDADILPYGVLQQLQGPRAARETQWRSKSAPQQHLQPQPVLSTWAQPWQLPKRSAPQRATAKPRLYTEAYAVPFTQRRRMPRLERTQATGRHFKLYDGDGEPVIHLHYHSDELGAAHEPPALADGWQPMLARSSVAAGQRQARMASSPSSPQVQHFWLQV